MHINQAVTVNDKQKMMIVEKLEAIEDFEGDEHVAEYRKMVNELIYFLNFLMAGEPEFDDVLFLEDGRYLKWGRTPIQATHVQLLVGTRSWGEWEHSFIDMGKRQARYLT